MILPPLPYQKIVFESPLNPEEARQRLAAEVAPLRSGWQWVEKRTETFEGTVSAEDFQIHRIIRYRNSFLPVIHGRILPGIPGARIEVTLKLHTFVLIFSLIWLGFVGPLAGGAFLQFLTSGGIEPEGIIPALMLIFFVLMVVIGFGIEAYKARKLLSHIFAVED